jgi:ABC-2 type transport system ATP-binding protein
MTSGVPLIEVDALTKRYRRETAVDRVTLAIAPGEIFGLLGPDGAGKSTIIQILAGVLIPDAGRAVVAGLDVLHDPEGVKRRIGYMPQGLGLNLYDDLTIDEHLEFFAELRGVAPDKFREHRATLLEITRLASAAHRLARHLSGGMRQKLGLVSALIHLPDILLLDEPTTGVDPLSRRDFWQIIDKLSRERGITVLLTTPYLDEAERCHRVALMHRGRLLAAASPDELKFSVPGVSPERVKMEDVFVALMASGEAAHEPMLAAPPLSESRGSPMDRPAIRVENLTKRYDEVAAVDGVSFEVRSGEIFGFLGPNGAGKTTTIKILAGLLRPTAGQGWVGGYDVLRQADMIKRTIGYMSQRFSLYPDLTVVENLRLSAGIYGLRGQRARDREAAVAAATGLGDWLRVLARDLPLGIRQRLALGCALLHEARILFLDEPTAGVDPLARRRFWGLIKELSRRDGVTVLVSTHYMDEAEHCDRLAFLHMGRLVALGEPEDLRRRAVADRGAVLEVSSPDFRRVAALLEPEFPNLTLSGRRIHVFSTDPAGDRRRIEQSLATAALGTAAVQAVPMSMDDVFATLIEGAPAPLARAG